MFTMKRTTMSVFIFTFLVCQVLHIFGKVIVLRGASQSFSTVYRKLICLSEDDGSALIWNTFGYSYETRNAEFVQSNNKQFYSTSAFNNNTIDCKMTEDCLKLWLRKYWTITNSSITYMAPVFDQRWEEFKEYKNPSKYKNIGSLQISAALSFSIRAQKNVQILFCENKNYWENLCYWVIIGGWENAKSVIRKCPNGLDFLNSGKEYPEPPCKDELSHINHTALSANEWRSFVITLDSRNITVYDTANKIMTYNDAEIFSRPNKSYEIFIAGNMLLRFHLYNFLYTTIENASLTSPIFEVNDASVCIQMFIGLCAECHAHVFLRNSTSNRELEKVVVKGSSKTAIHGLPTWQSVQIKTNLTSTSSLFVQVIPKLYIVISNPLWAIANVRQCPSPGSWRRSAIAFNEQSYFHRQYYRPKISCQKLFYNEHIIVNATDIAKKNITLDDENCDEGKLGPRCLFSCERDLYSPYDCKGITICYKNGCTCPPGFLGDTCSDPCEQNKYGHDCKKTCGVCAKASIRESSLCDKISGACFAGFCNDTIKYDRMYKILYLLPLCQTAIDASVLPVINYTSNTNIRATVPMTWKNEYKGKEITYTFEIKENQQLNIRNSGWSEIFQNITYLIGNFENLKPGTEYQIKYTLNFKTLYVTSDWRIVETDCNPTQNFDTTPGKTTLTINWRIDKHELYSCPENKYRLIVIKHIDELEQIVNKTAIKFFPSNVSSLTSYTLYNVTILYKSQKLFSKEIRTLEGVPSIVLDLQANVSSNKIILTWRAPNKPNGIIKYYIVTLRVQEYYGCKNLGLFASNNHTIVKNTTDTTITISNLQPYANYSVQVTAYNSRHGGTNKEITLGTKESEIPAETFGQLVLSKEWILSWSRPEDCTTISGRIEARIKISGVSNAVKNFSFVNQTKSNSFYLKNISQLHGAERYVARVYVVRSANSLENASAYREYEFQLSPAAPPPVTNLDVVEIDTRHPPETVLLRWQNPIPPINGKLDYYVIRICDHYGTLCRNISVQVNKTCDLWDDYICDTVNFTNSKIQILAYNINVSQPSDPIDVTSAMLNNATPDTPGNFNFTVKNNSVIDVKWIHPWKTGRHLQYFLIQIHKIASNLTKNISELSNIKVPVKDYMRYYEQRLYLVPSTEYNISIQAVTVANRSSSSNNRRLQTPTTIDFDGNLDIEKFDSTILRIPPVSNDTLYSKMHIIVKGPKESCKQHYEVPSILKTQISIKNYESAWLAAEGLISKFANRTFVVGNNKAYGRAMNCPLKPEGSYEITVVLIEGNLIIRRTAISKREDSSKHYETWLILIPIICLIPVGAALYFYRRKKQQLTKQLVLQNELVLSQDIENYVHKNCEDETAFVTSTSKQNLSIPSSFEVSLNEIKNNGRKTKMTSLIKVKNFEDYVREAIQSELLDKQYRMFPKGQTQSWNYGQLPQNKSKNRCANLIAYDKTRVKLKKLPDDAYSDYINANYITGYKTQKRYIATQGPLPNTVVDFWRMIWQENVLIICMLVNVSEDGKVKCEQYWPDIGKKKTYGDVIVLNAKHNVFADYCFRTFQVTCGDETRKIEHLHYTAWPDYGVPLYTHSIVMYLKKLLATSPGNGPIVVHSSAGVGKTGTIILCDICLRRAAAEGFIDVFAEMESIRSERINMVNNKQQYLLAHLALVECLLFIPITLPCNKMLPIKINELKKRLPAQQQRLQNIAWQNEALRQVTTSRPLSQRNRAKNRFPELISDKIGRIYLKKYPISDKNSDYLSAVYVDGVKLRDQYVATQLPMPSTIGDFWRMIAEFKVELILMLQPPDPQDPTCCAIAPTRGEFKPVPYLNITIKETVELEHYVSKKLLLVDNSEKPSREQSITILCLTEWKSGRNQPPPPVISMVTLWQAAERIARGDGPIVTLCHDGVTGCGLYLALSFMLERMAVERECDVCLAVRAIRRSRPDFVQSLEHLEYLCDAAVTYFKYFETYANFS